MPERDPPSPVRVDPVTGQVFIDLAGDAANLDWIRAARLKAAADAGDPEAARQLKELEQTPTVRRAAD